MIPNGICVDLETSLTAKIPDHIRPSGKKRYETRILEIGAVAWKNPTLTYQALVNPIPNSAPIHSTKDLFQYLRKIYQNPTRTLNFWSRVLVHRKSLNRSMFEHPESPEVWLARQVDARAKDFVRWHNQPETGPDFVTEKQGLLGLIHFTTKHRLPVWLAHNGNSFDFKVLDGCSMRVSVPIPDNILKTDTLRLFRKVIPGHVSYSQPILYKNIFKKHYNAHVAIDDAKALSELCAHAHKNTSPNTAPLKKRSVPLLKRGANLQRRSMNLTFGKRPPPLKNVLPRNRTSLKKGTGILQLRGIGPKTAAALAAVHIATVTQLRAEYKKGGTEWLKSILPCGARWKVIAESIDAV